MNDEKHSIEASVSNEMFDRHTSQERGACFLGYRGKCSSPACPHTVNETDECERCGADFVFTKSETV